MKVFVTGSTGFVGTAVVEELLNAGHSVLGLTRSDKGAEQLQKQGAEVLRGTIEDLDLLREAASRSDAVLHLAFVHDFANFANCCAIDRQAIEALGSALADAGGSRVLVITSGAPMMASGQLVTEDMAAGASGAASPRAASESLCLDFSGHGVCTSVVRLPPITHGPGSSGFGSMITRIALQKGFVAYVGDGQLRISACHRADAAKVYRLAMEHMEHATGPSVFHAVAETVPMQEVATAIGQQLELPVRSISIEQAAEYYGWLGPVFSADRPVSSTQTRETLGWTPTGPSLVDDVPVFVKFVQSSGV